MSSLEIVQSKELEIHKIRVIEYRSNNDTHITVTIVNKLDMMLIE